MTAFMVALALLAAGYLLYGRLVERAVKPNPDSPVPANSCADGIDFVAMPTWRVFLIQLLNIAGLGPVFGAIMGALWGPQVFLWVVFGSILGGAVHDMMSGVMSVRNNGASLPELIGRYLGKVPRHITTLFILILMILVGAVFVKGPAELIVQLIPAQRIGDLIGGNTGELLAADWRGSSVWLWCVMAVIFAYYILATLLPVDKIIGRIYPIFGAILLIMVLGLLVAMVTGRIDVVPFTLENLHPKQTPAWPTIFITVSCGAVSGFHATQSPLMARCLKSETRMRAVFYGSMIVEAVIALIWAAAAAGYYGGSAGLAAAIGPGNNPAPIVMQVCKGTMGTIGGILAVLGVVVLPITSGDTAFRAARLIAADYLRLPQKKILNRYIIAIPMFVISAMLNFVPFGVVWRYFGWANQTLAAVTLWAAAAYLVRRGGFWWLMAAIPATFMTVMTVTFFVVSKNLSHIGMDIVPGTIVGLGFGLTSIVAFIWLMKPMGRSCHKHSSP
ncbi:MAG TPA: carbon starvation CstA family protein [Myxococcota bacterium]|nr:carbon starvation CstA family protein [Myxococcota bacterium]HOA14045.1 carbon starvation CstA family protein [Myxococcota bacterium]HOC98503.1 carbon starvation CstA family protein [Myxococcota bacterium]HOH77283.1 carbon starvation CstA family protein [Myxococcota bacterium]HPV03060.1 carbon starvation CstA family protein [Myxococcota bacterium]